MFSRFLSLFRVAIVLALVGPASAELLVGGDLLNGNFNNLIADSAVDSQSFSNTVAWVNLGTGGADIQATRTAPAATSYDGTRNAVLSAGTGKVFTLDTGHEIEAGERFSFSYVWRDASGWTDATDQVHVSLFVTSDNTVTGARTNLIEDYSGTSTVNSTYEEVVRENLYTGVSADVGKILFVAIDTANASGYSRLDNFTLSVSPPPVVATIPSPSDGAEDVPVDTLLTWIAGVSAGSHDIYFGSDFDDVNDATTAGAVYMGNQVDTAYQPDNLVLGQTYFWRVDEVNLPPDSTVFKGQTWSFTVEPVAYPVQGVVATSNGVALEGQSVQSLVNGSGLNEADEHSINVPEMWAAEPNGADPMYIQFEFPRVYKMHEILVWNYNMAFETLLGIGTKEATIGYSLDGADWTVLGDVELAQGPGAGTYVYNSTVDLQGVAAKYLRLIPTANFGGGAQFGLSEVRFTYIPAYAREPEPQDGAADVYPAVDLSWRAGRDSVSHEIYVGTDPNALDLVATTDQAGYAEDLQLGQTYYWQVDEVAADGTWASDLWSFSTEAYLIVENFESYDDDEDAGTTIWQSWSDGLEDASIYGGSQAGHYTSPFAELTTFYGGAQAMPLYYDNTGDYSFSETRHTFATSQDWTPFGIQSLAVYVHGDLGNADAGRLYAKINDTKVYCDSVSDVLQRPQWMLWPIDLTQVGADLSNVTGLSLGIDDAGASGMIYVDDIRLHAEPVEMIEPVIPDAGDPNLAAYYAFDGNADDSTGNYPGAIVGSPEFVAGFAGQAISVNGVNDYVVNTFAAEETWPACSVSLWAKGGSWAQSVNSGLFNNNSSANDFQIDLDGTDPGHYRYHGSVDRAFGSANVDDWVHLSTSCDGATTDLYYNGLRVATLDVADTQFGRIAIGTNRATDTWFEGLIDEVRVYNRPLSAGEVAGLAGVTEPISTLGL